MGSQKAVPDGVAPTVEGAVLFVAFGGPGMGVQGFVKNGTAAGRAVAEGVGVQRDGGRAPQADGRRVVGEQGLGPGELAEAGVAGARHVVADRDEDGRDAAARAWSRPG